MVLRKRSFYDVAELGSSNRFLLGHGELTYNRVSQLQTRRPDLVSNGEDQVKVLVVKRARYNAGVGAMPT